MRETLLYTTKCVKVYCTWGPCRGHRGHNNKDLSVLIDSHGYFQILKMLALWKIKWIYNIRYQNHVHKLQNVPNSEKWRVGWKKKLCWLSFWALILRWLTLKSYGCPLIIKRDGLLVSACETLVSCPAGFTCTHKCFHFKDTQDSPPACASRSATRLRNSH